MVVVETIGRIRREHLQKGKSIKEIARDLKISRNTVRKVLRSGAIAASFRCARTISSSLLPARRRRVGRRERSKIRSASHFFAARLRFKTFRRTECVADP
jgi:transposase-like protein